MIIDYILYVAALVSSLLVLLWQMANDIHPRRTAAQLIWRVGSQTNLLLKWRSGGYAPKGPSGQGVMGAKPREADDIHS